MSYMNWTELVQLLGTENVDKIKETITNELIENLRESIKYEWITLPSEIEDMWDDMITECMKKAMKKYKKQIEEAIDQKVEYEIMKMRGDIL